MADVKKVLMAVFFIALLLPSSTEGQLFKKDDAYITGGYGLGNLNISDLRGNIEKMHVIGPLYFKISKAATSHTELGLNISYYQVSGIYNETIQVDTPPYYAGPFLKKGPVMYAYSIHGRINIHIGHGKLIDPYFGIGMGYRGGRWFVDPFNSDFINTVNVGPIRQNVGFAVGMGANVKLTDNLMAYTEIGLEKAFAQFGLRFKLPIPAAN